MDPILQLGEISGRLYFVTSGRVGVFVSTEDQFHKEVPEAAGGAVQKDDAGEIQPGQPSKAYGRPSR